MVHLRYLKQAHRARLIPYTRSVPPETRLWRHSTYFCWMSVTRETRRRLSPDRSLRPFEPCLPRPAKEPPAGPGWIHEIKHDGFRILARRDANGVQLFTRNGYNFAERFTRI